MSKESRMGGQGRTGSRESHMGQGPAPAKSAPVLDFSPCPRCGLVGPCEHNPPVAAEATGGGEGLGCDVCQAQSPPAYSSRRRGELAKSAGWQVEEAGVLCPVHCPAAKSAPVREPYPCPPKPCEKPKLLKLDDVGPAPSGQLVGRTPSAAEATCAVPGCGKPAHFVVHEYIGADDWRDRHAFVRAPSLPATPLPEIVHLNRDPDTSCAGGLQRDGRIHSHNMACKERERSAYERGERAGRAAENRDCENAVSNAKTVNDAVNAIASRREGAL